VVRRERVAGGELELVLPRAPAAEARAQVAAALAEERRLDRIEVMQVAAIGFDTDLVVLAWQVGPRAQAVLYDERRDQLASRTASARDGASRALPAALRQVAQDWAGDGGGASGGMPTWGWALVGVGSGLLVAGTAILTWALVDPSEEEPRYELVYGP
jgi:hypothetical protein